MHPLVEESKPKFEGAVDHLLGELAQLRTGRATPAIVEDLTLEAYGAPMTIKGVASITVPDAKTIAIEPWDKGLLKAIEKAIQEADIGINPVVDSKLVRLQMPAMTEESRKKLVKLMNERLETARVAVRGVREEARGRVVQAEKAGGMSEDEKFKLLDDLEKMTKDYIGRVEDIGAQKEKEIMTV